MQIDLTSQDVIVHPRRGITFQASGVSRQATFGKPSFVPPGMLRAEPEDSATVAEPVGKGWFDKLVHILVIGVLSHVVGIFAHWELLGHMLDVALEARGEYKDVKGRRPTVNPLARAQAFGKAGKIPLATTGGTDLRFGKR